MGNARKEIHLGRGKEIKPGAKTGAQIFNELQEAADLKIKKKWDALGGKPGAAKNPGRAGLIASGDTWYREYVSGSRIYTWSGGTFEVYGAIGERYTQVNAAAGWLGCPMSDELEIIQGGRGVVFQNGTIYWWPDTGAIDLGPVKVNYTGLFCFGETDDDVLSPSDEPYAIIGLLASQQNDAKTVMTQRYEDVDSRDARIETIELFVGQPSDLALTVLLMEEDDEDHKDKYKDAIHQAVEAASKGIGAATNLIPYVGKILAPIVESVLKAAGPGIVNEINDAFNFGDDQIDLQSFILSGKDIVRCAKLPSQDLYGIKWHLESPILAGDGASYKVYFNVTVL